MEDHKDVSSRIFKGGIALSVLAGIVLSLYQFYFNRGLWLDEVMLASNIIDRSFLELLQPLDFNQIAPIGFLWVEKLFTLIFGNTDYALSLFPLLGYLGSLPLVYRFVKKVSDDQWLALLSLGVFSVLYQHIALGSEVKQYATDVFFSLAILNAHLSFKANKTISYFLYALLGVIAIWFSNITVVILFTVGLLGLYRWVYLKKEYAFLGVLAVWSGFFVGYYFLFFHDHPTKEYMLAYWQTVDPAFLPLDPFSKKFGVFFHDALSDLFGWVLGFGRSLWFVPLPFVLFGLYRLASMRKYALLFILVFPLLVHLGMSALKLYPFATRLVLYTSPFLIFLFVYGWLEMLRFSRVLSRHKIVFSLLALLPVGALLFKTLFFYPIERSGLRDCMEYLAEVADPEEKIYVLHRLVFAYDFYQKSGQVSLPNTAKPFTYIIPDGKVQVNGVMVSGGTPDDFQEEFRGQKQFWYISKAPSRRAQEQGEENELQEISLKFLEESGFRIKDEKYFYKLSCYLYEPAPEMVSPDTIQSTKIATEGE